MTRQPTGPDAGPDGGEPPVAVPGQDSAHIIAVNSMAMLAELFTVEDGGTHLTTRTADRLH